MGGTQCGGHAGRQPPRGHVLCAPTSALPTDPLPPAHTDVRGLRPPRRLDDQEELLPQGDPQVRRRLRARSRATVHLHAAQGGRHTTPTRSDRLLVRHRSAGSDWSSVLYPGMRSESGSVRGHKGCLRRYRPQGRPYHPSGVLPAGHHGLRPALFSTARPTVQACLCCTYGRVRRHSRGDTFRHAHPMCQRAARGGGGGRRRQSRPL